MKLLAGLFVILMVCICGGCANEYHALPSGSDSNSGIRFSVVRVASFNIWRDGKASKQPLSQTAEVIKASKADIVGLQESSKNAKALADLLGWNYVRQNGSAVIMSRFEIPETTENKYGVRIRLDSGQEIFVFNVHLRPFPYQPYQLLNIPYHGHSFIKTEKQAIAAAQKARGHQVEALLKEIKAIKDKGMPIFITGDFNEPSHLDWTAAAARSGRHPVKVVYPTSKALAKVGFVDTYRAIYPDEMKIPGYTWTPLTKVSDPKDHHDRIDFVYYRGKGVKAKSVQIVGENPDNGDIVVSPYPSDHRAVVSTFNIPRDSK